MAIITGTDGDDTLTGTASADTVLADDGNDTVFGGLSNDLLSGNAGDDFLFGGAAHDSLIGGYGNDVLDGNTGNDSLKGGEGEDTFVWAIGQGRDVIRDFEKGDDTLDMTFSDWDTNLDGALTSADDHVRIRSLSYFGENKSSTVINFDGTHTLTVHGVTGLTADDFAG
jgi:Ca2+-binding RTX toxin-like protein